MSLSRLVKLSTTVTVGLATAAALTCVAATPAHAEAHERADAVGDLTDLGSGWVARGIREATDIVRVRANHKGANVRVIAWVDDLARADQLVVTGRIRTPDGSIFQLRAQRLTLARGFGLVGNQFTLTNEATGLVECDGVAGSFVNSEDRIWIRAPRSCFGNPASIAYGVGTQGSAFSVWRESGGRFGFPFTAVADDARRVGNAPAMPSGIRIGQQRLAHN